MIPTDVRVSRTLHNARPAFLVVCPADHRYVRDTEDAAHAEAMRHGDCAPRPTRPRLTPMPRTFYPATPPTTPFVPPRHRSDVYLLRPDGLADVWPVVRLGDRDSGSLPPSGPLVPGVHNSFCQPPGGRGANRDLYLATSGASRAYALRRP